MDASFTSFKFCRLQCCVFCGGNIIKLIQGLSVLMECSRYFSFRLIILILLAEYQWRDASLFLIPLGLNCMNASLCQVSLFRFYPPIFYQHVVCGMRACRGGKSTALLQAAGPAEKERGNRVWGTKTHTHTGRGCWAPKSPDCRCQ